MAGTVTTISVRTWPDESTRTPNSACAWVGEVTVGGQAFTARSRHGAVEALARQLVDANLADAPMEVRHRDGSISGTYRSFHAAAKWTYAKGVNRPLRRVRYTEPADGLFARMRTGHLSPSTPDPVPEAGGADTPLESAFARNPESIEPSSSARQALSVLPRPIVRRTTRGEREMLDEPDVAEAIIDGRAYTARSTS